MVRELMLASGVYDPSHVFPEAIKMQGAVQQQSLAALRTGYRMLCDVQGNASLSDKHQQVPLASPSSPFLPLTSPTVCQAAVVGAPRETIARQTSKSSQRVDHADTSALRMHVGMLCAHAARAYEPLSGRRGFFFPIESQVVKRVLAMMGWDKAMLKRKMPFTARQVQSSSPSLTHANMRTWSWSPAEQEGPFGLGDLRAQGLRGWWLCTQLAWP
jgi:hypothetical protein